MLLHRKKVMSDIDSIKTDWQAGNYYKAGKDGGDLVDLVLGPVAPLFLF